MGIVTSSKSCSGRGPGAEIALAVVEILNQDASAGWQGVLKVQFFRQGTGKKPTHCSFV